MFLLSCSRSLWLIEIAACEMKTKLPSHRLRFVTEMLIAAVVDSSGIVKVYHFTGSRVEDVETGSEVPRCQLPYTDGWIAFLTPPCR